MYNNKTQICLGSVAFKKNLYLTLYKWRET